MTAALTKLPTGIEGLDLILAGGLPAGRTTLVSGTAGSAKTVLACQFLAEGVRRFGQAGVFVTFEETLDDIRKNVAGFGWPLGQWERDGKWAFVDGSPRHDDEAVESGPYDLGALLSRIEHAVRRTGATRVSIDTLGGVFVQFGDAPTVRRELFRVIASLKQLGVTALVTAERAEEGAALSRFGVEEFVTDNVVVLRNVLEDEKRRRTVEVLKLRGTNHQKGEVPFTVSPGQGVVVLPLSAMELKQRSSTQRVPSGNAELDRMCGGGLFRDSIVLVSGPTGTGKTLITTHFMAGGVASGERCLLFAFEESRDQLFRNASGWGVDLEALERQGLLRVQCVYPEFATLEEHLIAIKREIETFRPARVAVDSLSALERIATPKNFREFVVALTSFIKTYETAGLFTATTSSLLGGTSVTETHISSITDSIVLLRYVEMFGEMRRGITVLKMRGSPHDKEIRELTIDGNGMHVGKAFRTVSGILSGQFSQLPAPNEFDRLGGLFRDEGDGREPGAGPDKP